MSKKNLLKTMVSVMLILAMSMGLMIFSAPKTYAASSSGKLVKTVKHYYKSGKKWKLRSKTTYTYNSKKDPTKIVVTSYYGKKTFKTTCTIKYKYKNGKKAEAKEKECYADGTYLESTTTYDSKGRPSVIQSDWSTEKLVYGKNGYVTKITQTTDNTDTIKTVIKYKWNGSKAKSLRSYELYNGGRFKKALTVFNKKGFVQKPKVYTQADPVMIYTYKYKKGLIKTINLEMQDGYDRYYEKDVITYTNKSISQKRYRAMINSLCVGNYPDTIGTTWY